ncbi:MAG: DUF3887 domain-containing protein [Cyanobium sp. M30B3]|nr:MAG: DUF3887 domain-containing protein [Cyanobium sp. M30B3]
MARAALLALGLLSSLGLGLSQPPASVAQTQPGSARLQPQPNGEAPRNTLSVEQARAAANRILEAIKTGDPNLRYSQFSDQLKAISSPTMVAETMRRQPKLLSWTLLSVRGGLRTTTVEAALQTSAGTRDLFMVLNDQGQLDGYHLDLADEKSTTVAADFVKALSGGHFITARSFLSLPLQRELTAATLQAKWQQLQRYTGNFIRVGKVVAAEYNEDSQLVLVNTEFNRTTDTLFVVLNRANEIISVDFPQDPIRPRPVAGPLP